jgi:hypothetical protein
MLLFLHGVYSKQCRGLSMGPEGRANVERPFAIEHLIRVVGSGTKGGIKKPQTLHFVDFIQRLVDCDYDSILAGVYRLHDTHTQISSNTIRRSLSI